MSGPERSSWEDDTVPTPRVRADGPPPPAPPRTPATSDTLEMPAVPAAGPGLRRPSRSAPASGSPAVAPGRSGGDPAPPDEHRSRRPRRLAALALGLVVAAGAGVLAGRLLPPAADEASLSASGSGDAVVEASWSSVDPVGGSGFRQVDARTWRTQSYRTAGFGNLKPGVGLVADLGAPREVDAVTVDVAPVGVVVELRAGDTPSQDPADYTVVTRAAEAAGPTRLDASAGGASRYWLVWVSELGPREGGFVAELADPRVEG